MNAEYILKKAAKTQALSENRDPFDAAKALGIKVSYKDLGSLKGAYFGMFDIPVIAINETLDENMQKIVCAHELGHHILHSESIQSCKIMCFDTPGILEREANIFAAAFLIDCEKAADCLLCGYTTAQTAAILKTNINLLEFLLSVYGLYNAPNGNFLK